MSVENSYFSVEWTKLEEIPEGISMSSFLWEAVDEEPWLCRFPFGPQIDEYAFTSTRAHMIFSDWFRDIRGTMDHRLVGEFSSLFMDFGILYDDSYDCVPIAELPDAIVAAVNVEDWLVGSIPPERVIDLLSRAKKIDLVHVKEEFQRALDQVACDVLEDGGQVVDWMLSLTAGLEEVVAAKRGVIMGMA